MMMNNSPLEQNLTAETEIEPETSCSVDKDFITEQSGRKYKVTKVFRKLYIYI